MPNVPNDLKYTKDHEWVRSSGNGEVQIGITDFAQSQLGDVVFVELPKPDSKLDASEPFGSVESVKSVSEMYMPVGGTISAVNPALDDEPELLNTDPYDEGWIIRVKPADPKSLDGLLTADEYTSYCSVESSD